MNTREKLLLTWAVVATGLVIVGGIVVFQMVQPRLAEGAIVRNAQEMAVGEKIVYECNRTTAMCVPTQGSSIYFADYATAIHTGAMDNYAVIWVTHATPIEWRAFSAASTHLGCFVNWNVERKLFVDPCSGGKWLADGTYREGPPPRDLDWYPVRVQGGDVLIDFKLMRGASHN